MIIISPTIGDSQLIIRQIQGVYKVKNEELKKLHAIAKNLLESIPSHSLEYIPRAQNVRADELSNMAMDTRQDLSVVAPSQSDPVLEDTGIDIDTDTDGLVVKSIDGDISVEDVSVIGESIHTEERQEIFQSNVGKVGSIKREEKTKFTFENVEIIMDQNEVGDDFTISVVELEGKKGATEKNRVEKYPCLQKIIKLIIVREKQVNPRSLSVVDGSDPNVVKETKKEKQSPIKGTVQSKKLNLVDGKETAALMSAKLKKSSTEQKVIEEESTTGDGTVETVIPPKESRKKKIHIIT